MGGATTSFGVSGKDFWIVNLDSDGNIQWERTYGGNMNDEAINEGIEINETLFSQILGKPAVKTSAKEKTGIKTLVETPKFESKLIYSDPIEEEIFNISKLLKEKNYKSDIDYREIAIKLLQEDKKTYKKFHDEPIWIELQPVLTASLGHIYIHYNTKDLDDIFSDEKNAFAKGVVTETVTAKEIKGKDLTSKIDSLLIHKLFGIPIFLTFMWILFQLTFEVGNIPMDMIDAFFASLIDNTKEVLGDNVLSSMIADGAIAGVGAVVLFLPNIVILFFGIALLETTGYMSRVAFLLDGIFHKFGLHGKSFIPLVSGFGCSVPAYMAARTLKNERDRLLTLFIIGFMSCGARLPVYVLFAGAFFSPEMAGNILFAIYISGAMIGLIAAKILKLTAFKGADEPFVMEMPKYRLPSTKLIWHTVLTKTMMYLKKAGTFIAAASMLIWFLSNYPHNLVLEEEYATKIEKVISEEEKTTLKNELSVAHLEQSYLGQIGKFSEPIFEPLGFDWKMSVALQTGLAAKEVVVSTLGVLYALGDGVNEQDSSLVNAISKNIPFASAVAFIVVIMIYLPCLAASIVFTREAGGIKYFFYLLAFTSIAAYGLAFIAYKIALLLT